MPTSGRAACPRVRLLCRTLTLEGDANAASADFDPGLPGGARARVCAGRGVCARRRGVERQIDGAHRHLDASGGGCAAADDRRRGARCVGRTHPPRGGDRRGGRSSSTHARPTRSTSTVPARRPCCSCRRTSARARSWRPRPARAQQRWPSFSPADADHHWCGRRRRPRLIRGMERVLASGLRRFVLLIEEPELYLSPHAQRHLYRLLRNLAQHGNQILYSTHAPVFLSVDRLEELALVRHTSDVARRCHQPEAAPRSGVVPRALRVRQRPGGALPRARGAARRGPHREARVPARVRGARRRGGQGGDHRARVRRQGKHAALRAHLQRVRNPVRHRRRPGRAPDTAPSSPSGSSTARSKRWRGGGAPSCLLPNSEAVSGVATRARARKPHRAYQRYSGNGDVPEPLKQAVEKLLREARA